MSRHAGWLLVVLLIAGITGCHLLPVLSRAPTERNEKEAIPGTPGKNSFAVSQFVFVSDFELNRNLPVFKELGELREQIYRELSMPPSNVQVTVYLFENQEKYERFMVAKYPDFPKRRAFFVAQPRRIGGGEDLLVFTYWGHRIHQDLRHELTHAVLNSALKGVPLWLDEGLAEYFETPPGWKGLNSQHVEKLRKEGFRADLDRLEKMAAVHEMTPAEYREAWAWVHLMLRSTPQAKQVLIGYLRELRTNPDPGKLAPRLASSFLSLETALRGHVADLAAQGEVRQAGFQSESKK